jgi:hypothetical protein
MGRTSASSTIEATHDELIGYGVDASEVFHGSRFSVEGHCASASGALPTG